MDIRNFFGAKGASKPSQSKTETSKTKTEVPEKKKKRANVISDSESEEEVEKKPKVETKKVTPKKEKEHSPKLKEINKSDFFGSSNASKPAKKTEPVKRKSPEKDALR